MDLMKKLRYKLETHTCIIF